MELSTETKVRKLTDAAVSAQTTVHSAAVDMAGFEAIILFTTLATASGTANFIKAEQCDTSDGDFEDIAGATATPATSGDLCGIEILNPGKRYVRLSIVRAGAAFATSEIFYIAYGAGKFPVDNIDNGVMINQVTSAVGAEYLGRIATPAIENPAEDDADVAVDALIAASTYATIDAAVTATHEKSQFQITTAADTDFLTPVLDEEITEDLEEYQLAGTEIDSETDYIIRVRYFTTTLGWSDWSPVIAFNTLSSGLAITSITPATGPNTGSTAVTIDGAEFVAGIGVKFNNVAATSVVRVSATRLTCATPAGTTGAVDIKLTNTDGGTATEASGFTYISTPTVDSLDVTSGTNDGGTTVVITGTEFAATPAVLFGSTSATEIVRDSATQITCKAPVHANGVVTVTVTNTDTGTGSKATAYTYFSSPTITLIDPATGSTAGGTAVTITGTEFAATPAVTFGGTTATDIVRVSATSITCVTPAKTAGAKDVVVTNTDTGAITATGGFEYTE